MRNGKSSARRHRGAEKEYMDKKGCAKLDLCGVLKREKSMGRHGFDRKGIGRAEKSCLAV